MREEGRRRMAVVAPLPPLLTPLAEQLEEYLVRPDLLPIHDTAPAQRSWWVRDTALLSRFTYC